MITKRQLDEMAPACSGPNCKGCGGEGWMHQACHKWDGLTASRYPGGGIQIACFTCNKLVIVVKARGQPRLEPFCHEDGAFYARYSGGLIHLFCRECDPCGEGPPFAKIQCI
jgi:hypothetical protein